MLNNSETKQKQLEQHIQACAQQHLGCGYDKVKKKHVKSIYKKVEKDDIYISSLPSINIICRSNNYDESLEKFETSLKASLSFSSFEIKAKKSNEKTF